MKKITLLLAIALVVISGCMIYLLMTGVSLRSAPLIRPSPITHEGRDISYGVVARLAPEFQNADYILWGVLPLTEESNKVVNLIKEEYEKVFKKAVHIVADAELATDEQLRSCEAPCWLFLPKSKAHELSPNEFITNKIIPTQKTYFTLSWISFSKVQEVPEHCLHEKRLDLECLTVLAVYEAQRKIKDGSRYFFMKKYNATDFFLFIQDPS